MPKTKIGKLFPEICPKSECKKGEKKIPVNPFKVRGEVPYCVKCKLNLVSRKKTIQAIAKKQSGKKEILSNCFLT